MSERSCGECQACCWALPVWTTNERVGTPLTDDHSPCRHQVKKGCSIYKRRPEPCAIYQCMWLLGWGEEADRPDRLGLIFEVDKESPWLAAVDEVRKDAIYEPRARLRLHQVKKQVDHIILTRFDGERVGINFEV